MKFARIPEFYIVNFIVLLSWLFLHLSFASSSILPSWISGKGTGKGTGKDVYETCSPVIDYLVLNGRAFNKKISPSPDQDKSTLETLHQVLTKVKDKLSDVKAALSPNDEAPISKAPILEDQEREAVRSTLNGELHHATHHTMTALEKKNEEVSLKTRDFFESWIPSRQMCFVGNRTKGKHFQHSSSSLQEIDVPSKNVSEVPIDNEAVSSNASSVTPEGSSNERLLTTSDVLLTAHHDENISEVMTKEDQLETYSQFAQRVKAEEQKTLNSANGVHSTSNSQLPKDPKKVKRKNYASTDCGAKFLAASEESSHAHKIISSNKDEYMLSKCTEEIWAVVELCENMSPQMFEIANFELYSNSPKEVRLFGSHRHPTREWTPLGSWLAEEGNREVQSFQVSAPDNQLFKYVKLEISSYYGTEFFCPLSLFRIFGLSEFEVIDEGETEDGEEHENDASESTTEAPPAELVSQEERRMLPDMLSSMFDGVYSVLKRSSGSSGNLTEPGEEMLRKGYRCRTLTKGFSVEEGACPAAAESLNHILSCYFDSLSVIIASADFLKDTRRRSFCQHLSRRVCEFCDYQVPLPRNWCAGDYFCAILSPEIALVTCHLSGLVTWPTAISSSYVGDSAKVKSQLVFSTAEKSFYNATAFFLHQVVGSNHNISFTWKSNSTATSFDVDLPKDSEMSTSHQGNLTYVPNLSTKGTLMQEVGDTEAKLVNKGNEVNQSKKRINGVRLSNGSETGAIGTGTSFVRHENNGQALPDSSKSPSNKESIVVRLSNRVKALEHNISISSQYLEELSQRYKREMEEMQRRFNLTFLALNRSNFEAFERDQQHHRRLRSIEAQVDEVNQTLLLWASVQEKARLDASNAIEFSILLLLAQVVMIGLAFLWFLYRSRTSMSLNQLCRGDLHTREFSKKENEIQLRRSSIEDLTSSPSVGLLQSGKHSIANNVEKSTAKLNGVVHHPSSRPSFPKGFTCLSGASRRAEVPIHVNEMNNSTYDQKQTTENADGHISHTDCPVVDEFTNCDNTNESTENECGNLSSFHASSSDFNRVLFFPDRSSTSFLPIFRRRKSTAFFLSPHFSFTRSQRTTLMNHQKRSCFCLSNDVPSYFNSEACVDWEYQRLLALEGLDIDSSSWLLSAI